MRKTVGLVAKGPGWEESLNYPEMELWGVNDSIYRDENIDLCFFMDRELFLTHDFTTEAGRKAFREKVCLPPEMVEDINNIVTKLCNERNLPLYCTKKYDDIPTSMEYPIKEIKSYFGTDYFGNSLDFMIAMAIYQGYEVIHTFGLTMSYGSKYIYEKPSTTFWIGVALGMGIELHLHGEECQLLRTMNERVYAYHEKQILSQENIKIHHGEKQNIALDFNATQTIPLLPIERILLINLMPEGGRYELIKKIDKFKEALNFTDEEQKALALHADGTGKTVKFIENGIPPKHYDIDNDLRKAIKLTLKNREKEGKLNKQLVSLYERFVLGNEE